jgi:hypothetical protein
MSDFSTVRVVFYVDDEHWASASAEVLGPTAIKQLLRDVMAPIESVTHEEEFPVAESTIVGVAPQG